MRVLAIRRRPAGHRRPSRLGTNGGRLPRCRRLGRERGLPLRLPAAQEEKPISASYKAGPVAIVDVRGLAPHGRFGSEAGATAPGVSNNRPPFSRRVTALGRRRSSSYRVRPLTGGSRSEPNDRADEVRARLEDLSSPVIARNVERLNRRTSAAFDASTGRWRGLLGVEKTSTAQIRKSTIRPPVSPKNVTASVTAKPTHISGCKSFGCGSARGIVLP